MSVLSVFQALLWLGLLLLVGRLVRERVPLFRRIFLPSSILAGVLGLLLGAQVLGRWLPEAPGGIFPEAVVLVWRALPGVLINVVFAALFLGTRIPGPAEVWRRAGPQVAFGQVLAWGQYAAGMLLTLLVLTPFFDVSPLAGALIEITFEGGHGTAAGMAGAFRDLGFPDGADLAMGLATVGVVMGVVIGTALINWGVRSGRLRLAGEPHSRAEVAALEDSAFESEPAPRKGGEPTTDPLAIQIGFVALAIALGWLLLRGLVLIEQATWGGEGGLALLAHVPLFPMAMLGGVILQLVLDRLGHGAAVDRHLMNRISGASLDFIIVAALSTLSLSILGAYLLPFLLLALTGIAWNVFVFVVLAPRMLPEHWFERGIGDFGQSMGVTVTGLLLIRMADPRNRSGALDAFGYKQLLTEPFVGGGLVTAASLPLIARFGGPTFFGAALGLTVFWMLFGIFLFRPKRQKRSP